MYPSQPPEGTKPTLTGRDSRPLGVGDPRQPHGTDPLQPQGVRKRQSMGWLIAAAIAAVIVIALALGYSSTSNESPVNGTGNTTPAVIPESGAAGAPTTGTAPLTDAPATSPAVDTPTTAPATDAPAVDAPATAPATGTAPTTTP